MNNPELTEQVRSIDRTLKDLLTTCIEVSEGLVAIDDELSLLRRTAFPQRQPRDATTWPWTPATLTQGFLSGRWLRRDGNVYGPGV